MIAARTLLIGLACVAVSVAADALFLPHQSIWNDEVTQMRGLTLNPVEVTRWLADRVQYPFGVADDRMPPLSYWAGWAWSQVFGLREASMRWFGVTCIAGATALVFAAANRAWNLGAGVAAALLVATSPNVVTNAVEIRSYPLLILASSGVFACLVGYADGPAGSRGRWLAGVVACGVAAMYAHFFGLVVLGGAMFAVLVLAVLRKEKVGPAIGAAAIVGLATLGLVPFVRASIGLSTAHAASSARDKFMGLFRLVYRQFSHPAISVSQVAVGVAAAAFLVGLICALSRKSRAGSSSLAVGLVLASGVTVVTLVDLAQSSFSALQSNYNSWTVPGLALFIASGLASTTRAIRIAALTAIVLTTGANAYGLAQLAVHGDFFAHTANRPVEDAIRRFGAERVAVIHDNPTDLAEGWPVHISLSYDFADKVREYAYLSGGPEADRVKLVHFPARKPEVGLLDLPDDRLIVVRSRVLFATDIAEQIRTGVVPIGDGPVTTALLKSAGWERIEDSTHLAFYGVGIDIFRRVSRP